MGQGMPKAVTSVVVKRWGGAGQPFRAGLSEMNGWRPSMEDAHVVVWQNTWGFFGVFDGHGGSQCSAFIAKRLTQELETGGMPEDDEAVTALALKLDREYLGTNTPSGSTGTFVIISTPTEAGGKYGLRVGNIGDSRVLLGRADGTLVEGEGTDGGLTTDHKPDHPDERSRIERTGGTVQEVMGVCRVNGDLAVSRAFGDAQYKETGGPCQEDHPVIAAPELATLECAPPEFVMLVCDGISESNFPNREVIKLAAEELRKSGGTSPTEQVSATADAAAAATAVCRMALTRGSKDNLSCMIVLLGDGGELQGKQLELLPGAADSLNHEGFRKAYEAMADHAGLTLAEAVEARYAIVEEEAQPGVERSTTPQELQQELAAFGEGPPQGLAKGSEERTQWFAKWVQEQSEQSSNHGGDRGNLVQSLMQDPSFLEMAQSHQLFNQGQLPAEREPVIAAEEEELRAAIQTHFALQWDARYLGVCGKEGIIIKRDDSDNTSQVRFHLDKTPGPMTAWFPNETLRSPKVKIADGADLRASIEESTSIEWDEEKYSSAGGQQGEMIKIDDNKDVALIMFEAGGELWLPAGAIERIGSGAEGATSEPKRPRTE